MLLILTRVRPTQTVGRWSGGVGGRGERGSREARRESLPTTSAPLRRRDVQLSSVGHRAWDLHSQGKSGATRVHRVLVSLAS